MSALPPPCEQLKKSIVDMGAEVSLDGLRGYVVRHGNGLVHSAFDAYHRQLMNWWPETLLTRYHELPRKRGADDARRQCLVRYLQNPSSGGYPADQPGGRRMAMARRWRKFGGSATPATGALPRPRRTRLSSPRPCRPSLLSGPQQFCLLPLFVPQVPLAFSCPLSPRRLRMCLGVRSPSVSDSQSAAGAAHP